MVSVYCRFIVRAYIDAHMCSSDGDACSLGNTYKVPNVTGHTGQEG